MGGHTPGSLAVHTPGLTLAGDNAYLYANIEQRRPIGARVGPDPLLTLIDRGKPLVPGHDPAILERFPKATSRIAILAGPGGSSRRTS